MLKAQPPTPSTTSVRFDPPAWEQRRQWILNEIRRNLNKIDWVLELGCGEGNVCTSLKNWSMLSRISMVDVCVESLAVAAEAMKPMSIHTGPNTPYERPLRVEILKGCLTEFELPMCGVDAIILTEVIEHLDPEPLANLPEVLFGFYRPAFVIVTTPNADYNKYFPSMPAGNFRDPDHRFEWTQAEFRAWVTTCNDAYGYNAHIHGIAKLKNTDDCYSTQIACFYRDDAPLIQKWPVQTHVLATPVVESANQLQLPCLHHLRTNRNNNGNGNGTTTTTETKTKTTSVAFAATAAHSRPVYPFMKWTWVACIDYEWLHNGARQTHSYQVIKYVPIKGSISLSDLWSIPYVRSLFRTVERARKYILDLHPFLFIAPYDDQAPPICAEIELGLHPGLFVTRGDRFQFKKADRECYKC